MIVLFEKGIKIEHSLDLFDVDLSHIYHVFE